MRALEEIKATNDRAAEKEATETDGVLRQTIRDRIRILLQAAIAPNPSEDPEDK